MAFSKMAGLEVTPPRPSSSTRRLSSPPEMRVRRMKSSQTDWPYCLSAATGLWTAEERVLEVPITSPSRGPGGPLSLSVPFLQGQDLGQAARVALFRRIPRAHERVHQLLGE